MQFTIPRSTLPDNKLLRRQLLDEYFPSDLIPFEECIGNEWRITSFIPDDVAYYADPHLEKSLEQWHESIAIKSLGFYWRIYKNAMLSFNDSWSLHYWSLTVQWLRLKGLLPKQVVLLHIDDHMDQGSPLLSINSQNYNCIFTQKQVNFADPSSIEEAIIQKSINICSFITPLVHALESVTILHLRYAHAGKSQEHYLSCTYAEDTLLAKGKKRPALTKAASETKHRYFIASDPSYLLNKVKDCSLVFLHLDCDGFNNRYNGDSNWKPERASIDLKLDQIKDKINDLLYQVSQMSCRIFMNVALSPGFFPSEYWQDVCKHIFMTAQNYGIVKDDDLSEYLKSLYPKEFLNEIFPKVAYS